MRYLLDTNAVSALMRNDVKLWARMRRTGPQDIGLSAIVSHELHYGAYKGVRTAHTLAQIDDLPFAILPFDAADARRSGEVRAALAAAAGTPIGPYDVLIAGQALARGLTLVSRNLREFERVPGLAVEDWESPPGAP
ncbi:type II toxin-antitoxin system VapC family toxin [uncultured Methylobacterium sp.]|uniref:type II toxin-antitoxin system VapC family toxin n=1 Tax=uncultured Methylobacterium sp. TaxID=157278 RepID=UPI00262930D8|nr:type II toxin-antitoxin system VapC family toxin [uncultured Methylobacterium sp.]